MDSSIRVYQGYLAAIGPQVDLIAQSNIAESELQRSSLFCTPPYHITIISKDECRDLHARNVPYTTAFSSVETTSIISLGLGGHPRKDVQFVVLIWNSAQAVRKRLGLPPKQFHITLSPHDDHLIDKGISSLLEPWNTILGRLTARELDHAALALLLEANLHLASETAIKLCSVSADSEKGFIRLADAAFKIGALKLAILSYGRALHFENVPDKLRLYCMKRLIACSKGTEWGCVFGPGEIDQIPRELVGTLCAPWSPSICQAVLDAYARDGQVPTLCIDSRARLSVPAPKEMSQLPRYFRWLVPFQFAIMSTPRHEEDIRLLASPHLGIRHIISLTLETPLPEEWFIPTTNSPRPRHTYIPIPDWQAPSVEQMDYILRLLQDPSNLPLLVHCGAGKGRAGTVAACYIAAYGFGRPGNVGQTLLAMSADDAIRALRAIRPSSVECDEQEKFVHSWTSAVWKRQRVLPVRLSEPASCDVKISGSVSFDSVDLLLLVGLPGSGKSYFSQCLLLRSQTWKRISQDESGSRSACETEIGRLTNSGRKVILDRCNPTREDRRAWVALAGTWARNVVCVYFDYDAELCVDRAQNRLGHPTLTPGRRVRNAVSSMQKSMEVPVMEEGFKGVAVVRSFESAMDLVRMLSPPVQLFKFPRTAHLLDLGAVAEDDIVAPSALPLDPALDLDQAVPVSVSSIPIPGGSTVIITEKLDGANMGISLSSTRSLLVQNRSHYVTHETHAQFKKLSSWLEKPHIREALYAILDPPDPTLRSNSSDVSPLSSFPERYVLFGEWLSATHSIAYTHLPDRFVAFDLYDRGRDRWASRDVLERIVGRVGIALAPIVWRGDAIPDDETMKGMVQGRSKFWDGRVEGIYVKVEQAGVVVKRGKVVRGDFIAGNDHWTKGNLAWNGIVDT